MSAKDQKVRFDLSPLGFSAPKLTVLLTDFHKPPTGMAGGLPMEPYTAFIGKISGK